MTDRRNYVTTYAYDNLHRQVGESWFANPSSMTALRTFDYEYDLAGRMTDSGDGIDYDYSYDYDHLNRLTYQSHDITGLADMVEFEFEYDRRDNLIRVDTEIDSTADYSNILTYDAMDRLTSVKQFDTTGNVVADKLVEFVYDKASQLDFVVRYAGLTTTSTVVGLTDYTFDKTGRAKRILHFDENSTDEIYHLLNGYTYEYDRAHRVTSMEVESPLYAHESVTAYQYNRFNELTDASYASTSFDESYAYDLNGNRTSANNAIDGSSSALAYTTTDNNQLQSDGRYTYTYDAEGNRATRSKSGEYTVYAWDHRNRLTSVSEYTDAGLTTLVQEVTYSYDDGNQLLTRTVDHTANGISRQAFVHQGGQMVMQFDAAGSNPLELSHRYLWSDHVDTLLADDQIDDLSAAGEVYWPLTDHLGTVRDLVISTPDGTMIDKHRLYDSFGNIVDERNRGDFNGDGVIDVVNDIDALIGLIVNGSFTLDLNGDGVSDADDVALADYNGDGTVDTDDLDILIEDIIHTIYGDGNLDGHVDASDFNIWTSNKFTYQTGWEYGDYDGNGVVDTADYNLWNTNQYASSANFDPTVTKHVFGFTGRMFDTATGLQNNLHRWYDAGVGRWLSQDPIGFAAGDANLYRYVGNGVTIWIDPNGLSGVLALGAAGGGTVSVGGGLATGAGGLATGAGAGGLAVTGGLVVAAGAGGYVVGTQIDEIGLNPFTWVFCSTASYFSQPTDPDVDLSNRIRDAIKDTQKLLDDMKARGAHDELIQDLLDNLDDLYKWQKELWGVN